MTDLSDLPLFGGRPSIEPAPRGPKRRKARAQAHPVAHSLSASRRIVALPLATNCRLVGRLRAEFEALPPKRGRAEHFRREVLEPLVAQRLTVGLNSEQVNAELLALEEAICRAILTSSSSAEVA